MPGRFARSLEVLAVSAFAISVSGCGSSAPAGFEAVAPAARPNGGAVCPDLRGTYVPGDDALMRSFRGTPRPDNFGYQMLLTIHGEPGGIMHATWHMDRGGRGATTQVSRSKARCGWRVTATARCS